MKTGMFMHLPVQAPGRAKIHSGQHGGSKRVPGLVVWTTTNMFIYGYFVLFSAFLSANPGPLFAAVRLHPDHQPPPEKISPPSVEFIEGYSPPRHRPAESGHPGEEKEFLPLLQAAKQNQMEKAVQLLENGADVHQRDESNFTPLIYASRFNNIGLVRLLIEKGSEINVASHSGRTPLIEAVINNRREITDFLIASGADLKPFSYLKKIPVNEGRAIVETFGATKEVRIPMGGSLSGHAFVNSSRPEIREREGLTTDPLTAAVRSGRNEMAKHLLDTYFAHENYPQQLNDALFAALQQKNTSQRIVSLLLDKGAAVSSRSANNSTPLVAAVFGGNPEIIDFLLSRGAETDVVNLHGQTPLLLAIERGRKEIVSLLLEYGAAISPLPRARETTNTQAEQFTAHPVEVAVSKNQEEIGILLLGKGTPIAPDKLGIIFRKALQKAYYSLADRLIEQGADVNMDVSPGTPLLNTLVDQKSFGWQERKETIEYLCRRGANGNIRDDRGYSPLHLAAQYGAVATAQILLRHGAEINVRSKARKLSYSSQDDTTPLLVAAQHYQPEMIHFLLKKGADPNIANKQQRHPLLFSRIIADPGTVKMLLEHRADPNAVDSSNRTPLFYTVKAAGNQESTKLLLNYGADPNHLSSNPHAFRNKKNTPLKAALRAENLEAAQLLLDHGADIRADCLKGMVVTAMAGIESDKARSEKTGAKGKAAVGFMAKSAKAAQAEAELSTRIEQKEKVIRFLINSGAELNDTGTGRLSPLMYAAQIDRVDYLQLLVKKGAEVDLRNEHGDTALIKAAEAGRIKSAAFLLANGADGNVQNTNGDTALLKGAGADSLEIVSLLLANGAEVRVNNKEGFSPYWLAKRNNNQEMAELLAENGAETRPYIAHVERITALKTSGLFPAESSPAEISPRQLELYLAMLTSRSGMENPESYKPDPRLSSPDKTWELHKQAMVDGDLPLFKKTLSRPDHPLIEIYEHLDPEKRRELVGKMKAIERIVQDDRRAQYRIHKTIKNEEITFYIYFSNVFGEWKIDDY
ncbi:MAG: ankyrin repeat domain-containing protein [Desulfobulbaceae bacterium]|nr:ankyrin repeat domain-containing protein [Desulfobulbaceae bacterium]